VAAQRFARVAQPPGLASNAGNPKGAVQGVPFFLVTFFLGKQEKVTAPPGHGRPQNKSRAARLLTLVLKVPEVAGKDAGATFPRHVFG